MTNCNCKADCTVLAVVSAITVGIVAAILKYTAIVTVTPAFLWVLFGIGVVYLGLSPVITTTARRISYGSCICPATSGILWGTLGTILTSVLLLGIDFAATSPVGAIVFGILGAFFTLTLASVACLTKCVARCDGGVCTE